jgi:hypothetical protein
MKLTWYIVTKYPQTAFVFRRKDSLRAVRFWSSIYLLAWVVLLSHAGLADSVPVHHQEGISHGFLVLRSIEGKILASGDLLQVVDGRQVTTEIIFHFKDGSLHQETAVFVQDQVFRLISDHLIQKGPSFPHPIDIFIDASKNQVKLHASEKGKSKDEDQSMELPEDLANGMLLTLLRNISPEAPETKVSMLSTSAKPRLVKLSITPRGERVFKIGGSSRKATDFGIHVEIGGIAGKVAPLIGKQPPDIHFWMSTGKSSTFVRMEGPLFEGGPIWRVELASPQIPDRSPKSSAMPRVKK